jgi:translation elongation factor aEF-1 beta
MGDVAIRYHVMPEGPDVDLGAVKAKLHVLGAREIKEQPVAFGIKLLDVLFVMPDKEGQTIEDKIREIEGVGSVETESVTLI